MYFDTVIYHTLEPDRIPYLVLYTEVNVFCIILLLQVIRRSKGSIQVKYQDDFNAALFSACVMFAADTMTVLMENGILTCIPLYLILKDIYFFSVAVMGFAWFADAENIVSRKFVNNRRAIWKWNGLVVLEGALLIYNWFNPVIFGIRGDTYLRGPLFVIQYIFGYAYILMAAFVTFKASFKAENYADRSILRSFLWLPIAPAAAGLFQYYHPDIPVLCGAITVVTEYISMKTASTLISADSLTRLNNRRRFVVKLQEAIGDLEKGENLYVMIMDVDYFKTINDTYGHPEGDEALQMVARSISRGVEKIDHGIVAARYGGDEFIAYSVTRDPDRCGKMQRAIEAQLESEEKKRNTGYTITLSFGFVRYEDSMSIADVIGAADQKLYEIKAEHHKQRS